MAANNFEIKNIIYDITHKRIRSNEPLYVVVCPKLERLLKEAGAITYWEDVSPGAVTLNHTICGVPYIVNSKINRYKIMTAKQFTQWTTEEYD